MQRIEQDRRIVSIERRRTLSLFFFVVAVILLGMTSFMPETSPRRHRNHTEDPQPRVFATMVAFGCVMGALAFQFYTRAFIIQRDKGSLVIVNRGLLAREQRREIALQGLTVRPRSLEIGGLAGRVHTIWIELPTGAAFLFQGNIKDPEYLRTTVARLIEDLRPGPASSPGARTTPPSGTVQ